MKHFYMTMLALALMGTVSAQSAGPNLLGAKGTFSAPFVKPKTFSWFDDKCPIQGNRSYNPTNNIGDALNTLSGAWPGQPMSGYTYVYKKGGLEKEATYTLIRNIGDATGGNCIKGDWRGQDHTGDGGWFMAVNGAPNNRTSPIFYSINAITVCPGTQYEFSAWVINLLPKSSSAAVPGSEPNISFVVKSTAGTDTIATSGPIAYTNTPTWVKVSGTFTVLENVTSVDLEVVNATAVASGNDLGLDDISLNVLQSNITVTGATGPLPNALCEGASQDVKFTVNDPTQTNTWYKWQISKDGGLTFTDSTAPAQATFSGDSYDLTLNFANVSTDKNGYKYRLVVSTSEAGLSNPGCTYVNEYTLIVAECGPTPVTLTQFKGRLQSGRVMLDWQTSQESNNDRFEIYRSNDGQNFSLIGSVKGAGNSSTLRSYNFADNQPGSSQYVYYKLRQVDYDGKSAYSEVVKVHLGSTASLQAYPNPFTSHFTASFTASKSADATLIIRNSIGQPVMQQTIRTIRGNNTVNINNLSNLKTGIYYVTISNDDINYNIKLQKQ